MGIADYGVNEANNYSYTASNFESWVNFTTLKIGNCSPSSSGCSNNSMTIQQNLVDYNVYESATPGEYWIQNVADISQSGRNFTIAEFDNIWNFSTVLKKDNMKGLVFYDLLHKCQAGNDGYPKYYYCATPLRIKTTLPFEILLNTTTFINPKGGAKGASTVELGLWVYHAGVLVNGGWYDEDSYDSKAPSSPAFQVGGMNPAKLYNDAETVLAGPGNKSSVAVLKINADFSESYVSPGADFFTPIPHAWSAGSDTAETVSGVLMSSTAPGVAIANHGKDNNVQLW